MSEDIITWWCPVCKTLTLLEQAMTGRCCQAQRPDNCPTPPNPWRESTDHNPWRETVRDIYDLVHLNESLVSAEIIELIEDRHPDFFGAG